MNTAREVVVKALSYKGLSDGDEFTRHYNERNGTALPLDCPWCATFVSDIMRMCGVPQSSVADYKGCTTGVEWFTAQGRFKSRQSGYIPKAGDIIFYEWRPQDEGTSRDDGADHTGIVVSAGGGVVNTVEGNSGNAYAVDEWTYPLDYPCIEGYGIPLYNMDNQPQDEPQESTTSNGDVTYQTNNGARWLPNVKNLEDCAGNYGESVSGIYVSVSGGDVYYRVRQLSDSRWLPEVKNREDYAGNLGQAIDALQIRVPTGKIKYRVHNVCRAADDWCPWVTCGASYGSTSDDNAYAGNYGIAIDAVQIIKI